MIGNSLILTKHLKHSNEVSLADYLLFLVFYELKNPRKNYLKI